MKCRKCDRDALIGRAFCEEHIGNGRGARARYYERRREKSDAEHLCRLCMQPLGEDTHKFCKACRFKMSDISGKYYREHRTLPWKVAGLRDVACSAEYKLECGCGFAYWCGENEAQYKFCPMCGKMKREVRL